MPTGHPKNGKSAERKHGVVWYAKHFGEDHIPMAVLRRDHTKIPKDDYRFEWKSAQRNKNGEMIYKNNYAPLGREPDFARNSVTRKGTEWEKAHNTLTNKGWNGLSARARAEYRVPSGVDAKYGNYVVVKAIQAKKKKQAKKKSASTDPLKEVDKAFDSGRKSVSKEMRKATKQTTFDVKH